MAAKRRGARWPAGSNLAEVARPVATDDGLQHPQWTDLYVFQGRTALSLRLRLELYDVQVFRFENQFADACKRPHAHREREREKHRQARRRGSLAALRQARAVRAGTSGAGTARLQARRIAAGRNEDG